MARLWLASGSPRRAALLRQIGVPFERLAPPDIDETPEPAEAPDDYVQRMAVDKARAGWTMLRADGGDGAVMGADTTVVLGGQILGKPADDEEAADMLRRLSDRQHRVLSAVSVQAGAEQQTRLAVTKVRFGCLTEELIRRYVATGEPRDKAGAYGIQGFGAVLVADIQGGYSNVVGLPLAETRQLLEWAAIPYWQDQERKE